MIAGHGRRSQCRQHLAAQGSETTCVQKIANISNAQWSTQMKLSLLHNSTPLNTPVWFICPFSFAHLRKNTTENFAPRESWLALIVGSRSWWQTKAAFFLLAPRPLECLVTGNLATKAAFSTGTHPQFCSPVECHGHVHVAINGPRHGRHFVLTSLCDPYCCCSLKCVSLLCFQDSLLLHKNVLVARK